MGPGVEHRKAKKKKKTREISAKRKAPPLRQTIARSGVELPSRLSNLRSHTILRGRYLESIGGEG